jgi:hypothetical protein
MEQQELDFRRLMEGRRYRVATDEEILEAAREVMNRRVRRGTALTSPGLDNRLVKNPAQE